MLKDTKQRPVDQDQVISCKRLLEDEANRDTLIAGQVRNINQMPVAVRQVLDESSQEMRCLDNMSANDIVETFKMCERAKLWLKQRKSKLTRRQYFEANAANDITQAYQDFT
ncbi:hypothetical protein A0J61_11177 [Choanephora cucurbitarum]|uniref:Uncharacterized protein n=1 Tax=Choanephora cucurbitarum TaxID=101091 RepID=A0A1C7N098_9FUNG|nr:hypothetical protein A0J61_11177 [Choanephora cucurbitarum]